MGWLQITFTAPAHSKHSIHVGYSYSVLRRAISSVSHHTAGPPTRSLTCSPRPRSSAVGTGVPSGTRLPWCCTLRASSQRQRARRTKSSARDPHDCTSVLSKTPFQLPDLPCSHFLRVGEEGCPLDPRPAGGGPPPASPPAGRLRPAACPRAPARQTPCEAEEPDSRALARQPVAGRRAGRLLQPCPVLGLSRESAWPV